MNDSIESLSIGLAAALVFSVPFAFFAYIRYLRYKETIALAERGLLKPERSRNGNNTLRWGIVILFLGLATLCGILPFAFLARGRVPASPEEGIGFAFLLLIGLLPMFFGLALIIIHVVTNRGSADQIDEESDDEPVPPNKG
jgi:hypothetical protein